MGGSRTKHGRGKKYMPGFSRKNGKEEITLKTQARWEYNIKM